VSQYYHLSKPMINCSQLKISSCEMWTILKKAKNHLFLQSFHLCLPYGNFHRRDSGSSERGCFELPRLYACHRPDSEHVRGYRDVDILSEIWQSMCHASLVYVAANLDIAGAWGMHSSVLPRRHPRLKLVHFPRQK
jgi:hypothetical protein